MFTNDRSSISANVNLIGQSQAESRFSSLLVPLYPAAVAAPPPLIRSESVVTVPDVQDGAGVGSSNTAHWYGDDFWYPGTPASSPSLETEASLEVPLFSVYNYDMLDERIQPLPWSEPWAGSEDLHRWVEGLIDGSVPSSVSLSDYVLSLIHI